MNDNTNGDDAGSGSASNPEPTTPYGQTPPEQQGPIFNPTSATNYGEATSSNAGSYQPYPDADYTPPPPPGNAPTAGQSYGNQGYGNQGYGGQQFGAPTPHQPPMGYYQLPPKHPNSTTALIIGLVAVIGGFLCGVLFLIGPWAWILGSRAIREIDANPGHYTGRGEALAGKVMGIASTVISVLVVLFLVLLIGIAVTSPSTY